jgi:hypothetical protein
MKLVSVECKIVKAQTDMDVVFDMYGVRDTVQKNFDAGVLIQGLGIGHTVGAVGFSTGKTDRDVILHIYLASMPRFLRVTRVVVLCCLYHCKLSHPVGAAVRCAFSTVTSALFWSHLKRGG